MKSQKGISTLLGIVIIVVSAAILFGGVFGYQYFVKSEALNSNFETNQNNQNSNTETAGWKTYTNNEYGFEIKYPNHFDLKEYDQVGWWKNITFHEENKVYLTIDLIESKNLSKVDLDGKGNAWSVTKKEAIVGGVKGKVVETFPPNDCYNVVLENKEITYLIGGNCSNNENLFNQIISTFKFTK